MTDPPDGLNPRVELQLESLYLAESPKLTDSGLPAHTISLQLSGRSEQELKGTLILDPNACGLDAFGDRDICTLIAVPGIQVTLERSTMADPRGLGRRLFEIRGEGLPSDLRMVVQGRLTKRGLERVYLVRAGTLVPLFVANER